MRRREAVRVDSLGTGARKACQDPSPATAKCAALRQPAAVRIGMTRKGKTDETKSLCNGIGYDRGCDCAFGKGRQDGHDDSREANSGWDAETGGSRPARSDSGGGCGKPVRGGEA